MGSREAFRASSLTSGGIMGRCRRRNPSSYAKRESHLSNITSQPASLRSSITAVKPFGPLRPEERSEEWIAVAIDVAGVEIQHRAATPDAALSGLPDQVRADGNATGS